jgi:hypothetical protein
MIVPDSSLVGTAQQDIVEGLLDFDDVDASARIDETDVDEPVFPCSGLGIEIYDSDAFEHGNVFRKE